jgi:hypothetical protein
MGCRDISVEDADRKSEEIYFEMPIGPENAELLRAPDTLN